MILDLNWKFRPDHEFTDFEVEPCVDEGDHVHVAQHGETPHFWSVYIRYNPFLPGDDPDRPTGFGGADYFCDCDSEEQANEVKEFLTNLIKNYKSN